MLSCVFIVKSKYSDPKKGHVISDGLHKKNCPICRNEFIVLNIVEEKAIYCTLKCLSESQDKMKKIHSLF
jgi:hypothetical protein